MPHHVKVKSCVPWLIADSDLNEANDGEVEYYRDLLVQGQSERHIGLLVTGQFDPSLVLGMVAIRCARQGATLIPLALAIPETPVAIEAPPKRPALDVTLLSAPVRKRVTEDRRDYGHDDDEGQTPDGRYSN